MCKYSKFHGNIFSSLGFIFKKVVCREATTTKKKRRRRKNGCCHKKAPKENVDCRFGAPKTTRTISTEYRDENTKWPRSKISDYLISFDVIEKCLGRFRLCLIRFSGIWSVNRKAEHNTSNVLDTNLSSN